MIQARPYISFSSFESRTLPVEAGISRFEGPSGVEEYHLMLCPTEYGMLEQQLDWVNTAYRDALASMGLGVDTCVFRRLFCSDLSNQAAVLDTCSIADANESCAVSMICQPPVPPAKVALWAYHVSDPRAALDKSKAGSTLALTRGELTHLWTANIACATEVSPYEQTRGIFETYESALAARNLSLADHVIRTWFFVRDVDANYKGLVDARRDYFATRGLTPDTHFIASTGIEGTSSDLTATISMDAYAIGGVRREQIQFLSAPDHLSPTYIYGVTFERGVSVAYRDRKHISISGTASIDSEGRILHPGDVLRQLDRTLENVEALLHEADASLGDACSFIVYVRDPSDLHAVRSAIRERVGAAPVQVVVAPVCRPGWLVEIECQAVVPASNPALPLF